MRVQKISVKADPRLSPQEYAIGLLEKAAALAHNPARVFLANTLLQKDAAAALELYHDAAAASAPSTEDPVLSAMHASATRDALYNLGVFQYEGLQGTSMQEPSAEAAEPYFARAAKLGDESAKFFLGHLRLRELPLQERDGGATGALALIEEKCGGWPWGRGILPQHAPAHRGSRSRRRSRRHRAIELLDMAVELDDADACFTKADMWYHGGDGHSRDSRPRCASTRARRGWGTAARR